MGKIIGNTTATPNPRPDWAQTDETKADFIKNKPVVLTAEEIKDLIDEFGGDTQIQADWTQDDNTQKDFIKNKPTLGTLASKDEVVKDDLSANVQNVLDTAVSYVAQDLTDAQKAQARSNIGAGASSFSGSYDDLADIPETFPPSDHEHDYIPTSQKGTAGGVAELDEYGHVPSTQLPSYVDDVIEGYINEEHTKFYEDAEKITEITPETGKIFLDITSLRTYRWGGTIFAEISESLALGETSTTAYYGDKGKVAYEHSQTTSGNPHGVTAEEIGAAELEHVHKIDDIIDFPKTETWIFTLEDGSTVRKKIYIGDMTIHFTINGESYTGEEWMTWNDWNDSDFNTTGQKVVSVTDASGNSVSLDSVIVGGTAYEVGFSSGMATVTFNLQSFDVGVYRAAYYVNDGAMNLLFENGIKQIEVPVGTVIKIVLDDTECRCGWSGEGNWEFWLNGNYLNDNDVYELTVKGDTIVNIECTDDDSCTMCDESYAYIVCKITEENGADEPTLISFSINEHGNTTTYQAEEGMTWGEWVDSEYNPFTDIYNTTKLYDVGFDGMISNNEHSLSVMNSNDGTFPRSTDLIIANGAYELAKD